LEAEEWAIEKKEKSWKIINIYWIKQGIKLYKLFLSFSIWILRYLKIFIQININNKKRNKILNYIFLIKNSNNSYKFKYFKNLKKKFFFQNYLTLKL
jgi:hypothetical protein